MPPRTMALWLICGAGAASLLLGIYSSTAISKAFAAFLGVTSLLGATYLYVCIIVATFPCLRGF